MSGAANPADEPRVAPATMRSSQLPIASPCHESWDAMHGDAERRFCGVCQKDVHNLSAMGHEDAAALLRARAGEPLCVRYTAEPDGALRFRDLVPRSSLTRKIVRAAFAATMLAACTPHGDGPPSDGLGDAVIDSVRQDTVPTADGGCDYATGPLTTVHLPLGHLLCQPGRAEVQAQPTPVVTPEPLPMMGAAPPIERVPEVVSPPVAEDPRPVQKMGEAMALPAAKDPFVPCDPEPAAATPEPRVHKLMGKPAIPTDERMGKRKPPGD